MKMPGATILNTIRGDAGFTLVEISVTLVAGSIVFGLVLAFYIGANRLISRAGTRQELETTAQSAMRVLAGDLRNALIVEKMDTSGYRMVLLSGDTVRYESVGGRLVRNGAALGLADIDGPDIRPLVDTLNGARAWNVALRALARKDTIELSSTIAGRQTAWVPAGRPNKPAK